MMILKLWEEVFYQRKPNKSFGFDLSLALHPAAYLHMSCQVKNLKTSLLRFTYSHHVTVTQYVTYKYNTAKPHNTLDINMVHLHKVAASYYISITIQVDVTGSQFFSSLNDHTLIVG